MSVCNHIVKSLQNSAQAASILLVFAFTYTSAQDLVNEGSGRFTNSTGAVIRFRASQGQFRNDNPEAAQTLNRGTIEFLGADNRFTGAASMGRNQMSRVGGLVRYAATEVTAQFQQIQARWYSNLSLEGSAIKRVPDGVRIGGETAQTGVFTASGGSRQYSGTLYFDNSAAQTIPGGESYQNVEIARGRESKRVAENTTVQTRGFFRQDTSNNAGLEVLGMLSIGADGFFSRTSENKGRISIGTSANLRVQNTLSPQMLIQSGVLNVGVEELSVYAGVVATMQERASIIVQTSSTLRLYAASSTTHGSVRLNNAESELLLWGNIHNDLQSRTNAHFHPQSTVLYASSTAQTLMPTSLTQPYGDLTLQNAHKTLLHGIVALAGTLRVDSVAADMGNGSLIMLTPSADALYTGQGEVRGAMMRILANTTDRYTFNNAETRFTASSAVRPLSMTMTILPETLPDEYLPQNDVRRHVRLEWRDSLQAAWTGTLRLGYRTNEITAPFQADNENVLGMVATTGTSAQTQQVRRLAGFAVTRRSARTLSTGLGFVEQQGLTNAASTPYSLISGEDLILRGIRETVRSVQNGRWSNPTTWNVLREPDSGDSVEITHSIHLGFRRNGLDGLQTAGQVRERFFDIRQDSARALARFIHIRQTDSSRSAALVVGSFDRSDSTFTDELPPQVAWKLASVRVAENAQFTRTSEATLSAMSAEWASRLNLSRLRTLPQSGVYGLCIAAPVSEGDSTRVVLESLDNSGLIANGGKTDIAKRLASTGFIGNSGAIRTFAEGNMLAQDSIGSVVEFGGNQPEQTQILPALRYSNLYLSGRSRKQTLFLQNANSQRPCIVHDSLNTSIDALWTLGEQMSVQALGGVHHEGSISNASRDAMLVLRGVREQILTGSGRIDALSLENGQGAVKRNGTYRLQSALNLVRGAMQTNETANLQFADNAVVTRFPQSSLAAQPLTQGRITLRTRGDGLMRATGELLSSLSTLDIANSGGYASLRNVRVQDTLRVSSRLWMEGAEGAYTLDFLPLFSQPLFTEDSSEIVGTVRRSVYADSLTRLFHNRYTSLQILPSAQNVSTMQATFRVMPQHFPLPNNDSSKIRRGIELSLIDTLTQTVPNVLTRVGYAWRTSPEGADETNGLETARVLLQRRSAVSDEWQTVGTPLRRTRRSAWNRLSEEGLWYWGVCDSVIFERNQQRFFALGVDSTRTVVPGMFLQMNAFLEGALPQNLERRMDTALQASPLVMNTLLREKNLLPASILQSQIPVIADSIVRGVSSDSNIVSSRKAVQILGSEQFLPMLPATTVDWLLLEVRPVVLRSQSPSRLLLPQEQDSLRIFLPLLLQRNGSVIGMNRQSVITLDLPEHWEAGGRFITTLHHRNHLPVRWRDTLDIAPQERLRLDWSDTAKVLGGARALQTVLWGGKALFSLIAGDIVNEQNLADVPIINRADYDAALQAAWSLVFREGYARADANLDGIITTRDANIIWNNRGRRGVR
ncbi:MAG: hypothetical protein MUF71_20770 [Candidatus Kapabacteria bacterium]|jgi:hypothetical protein|nr:hypothetical protein [Candidatus Kapabacteria bacterium]